MALVDLNSPDSFVSGVPFETFAHWRLHDPVHWTSEVDGPGYWALTAYEDVVAANRDATLFSSERAGVFITEPDAELLAHLRLLMLVMDPPRHTRYRLLVSRAFTPRHIRMLDEFIAAAAEKVVKDVASRDMADFVVDVAAELPLQVIAEIIGVPQADRNLVFDWSNRMVGSDDPEYAVSLEDAANAQVELFMYCQSLCEDRRNHPRDDILTSLVHAEIDGDRLTDLELNMFFMLLAVAGNETTRNLISHGMLALFEHPDEFRRLQADPTLLNLSVEEMLRWASPVMHFRRTATADTCLSGQDIAAGDKVVLWYTAANRDPNLFVSPESFILDRTPNEHIAFGGRGPHFCLGANLARSEARHLFAALVEHLPDISQLGEPVRLRSNFIAGIKHLPVVPGSLH